MSKVKIFFKEIKNSFDSIQIFKIFFGVYLATLGYYFFFQSSGLVTGGVGGLGLIISRKVESVKGIRINTSFIIIALNVILLILGRIFLGRKFFLRTILATILYPVVIFLYEVATNYNYDLLFKGVNKTSKLIISTIIGSILTGAGLGFVFNVGATTGGTDIIQHIFHKYMKIPLSVAIYIVDGIIVLLGLIIFSVEQTLFSVVAVLLIGFIVDMFILTGKKGYTAFIITTKPDKIKVAIYKRLDRGFTKINVKGGYKNDDKDMLICTVHKNEVYQLRDIVRSVDENAFSFFVETTEVVGNRFERRD